ncbi:hypothetical protein LX69_03497, partial [Breznakibacter xylanolyticus]
ELFCYTLRLNIKAYKSKSYIVGTENSQSNNSYNSQLKKTPNPPNPTQLKTPCPSVQLCITNKHYTEPTEKAQRIHRVTVFF